MNRHFAGLWRHPDFMKLWTGQTVSEFGARITREALPLVAVITLAASPAQLGILTAIGSLPVLLFGLFAGVWIDRVRRRPVMIAADLSRLVILLSVPAAALAGWLRIEILYAVVLLTGILGMIFEIAYRALLPTLIERRDLLEGNSKLSASDSLAEIGGPAIAGLLVQLIGAPLALLFDALSYLVSALSFALIRAPEPPSPAISDHEQPTVWRDTLTGWRFILADPYLRPLASAAAITSFFGNFFAPLYSLFAIRELALTPAQLGLVIGAGGLGALVGALVAGRMPRSYNLGRVLAVSLGIGLLLNLLIPLAHGPALRAMALLITAQIGGDTLLTIYTINEVTLRQHITPDHLLGRVNASVGFLVQGIAPAGALLGGLLATIIGPREALFVAVFGSMVGALWLLFSPVRGLHIPVESARSAAD